MTDDIVTRLQRIADNFKNGDEFLYADYETVCDAWRLIENMRTMLIEAKVKELGLSIGDLLEMMARGE